MFSFCVLQGASANHIFDALMSSDCFGCSELMFSLGTESGFTQVFKQPARLPSCSTRDRPVTHRSGTKQCFRSDGTGNTPDWSLILWFCCLCRAACSLPHKFIDHGADLIPSVLSQCSELVLKLYSIRQEAHSKRHQVFGGKTGENFSKFGDGVKFLLLLKQHTVLPVANVLTVTMPMLSRC